MPARLLLTQEVSATMSASTLIVLIHVNDGPSSVMRCIKPSLRKFCYSPGKPLTDLQTPSIDAVSKLIRNMSAKSFIMDSILTYVLKSSVDLFAPLIARLAVLLFTEDTFPSWFTVAYVTLLVKKKGLDHLAYTNFRPILNLHTISKIIEQVENYRTCRSSQSYNRFQFTYRRGYSTKNCHSTPIK